MHTGSQALLVKLKQSHFFFSSLQVQVVLAGLQPAMPVARAAQFSFVTLPDIDFALTITKGENHC
jgi:hypothetical protein